MRRIILGRFFRASIMLVLGSLSRADAVQPTITVDVRTSGHAVSPLLFELPTGDVPSQIHIS